MAQLQSWHRTVALAKETVWGTGVTPTDTIPVSDSTGQTNIEEIFDDGYRGQAGLVYDAKQGVGHGEVSFDGPVFPVEIGHLLMAIFGQDTIAGTGPYTHTFKVVALPPSYTIERLHGIAAAQAQRYTGARCGSLGFSWDSASGFLGFSSQWMSKMGSVVTGANPTATATGFFPGRLGVINSTNLTGRLVSGEFNLTRELEVRSVGGQQEPAHINVDRLDATLNLMLLAEDLSDYTRYLAGVRQSVDLVLDDTVANNSITFTITDCDLNAEPVEYDMGNIGQLVRIQGRGIFNATDVGPAQVVLENSRSTAY